MCGCASPVVERQGVRWRPDHADASCPSYGSVDYWIRHHRPICCLFRSMERDVLFSMDLSPIRRPDRQRRQRPSNHRPVVASIAQLQLYRRPLLFSPRALFAPGYLFPRSVSEIMGASKMQKEGFFSFKEKITLYPRATLKI